MLSRPVIMNALPPGDLCAEKKWKRRKKVEAGGLVGTGRGWRSLTSLRKRAN